jgi:hypothetical protein
MTIPRVPSLTRARDKFSTPTQRWRAQQGQADKGKGEWLRKTLHWPVLRKSSRTWLNELNSASRSVRRAPFRDSLLFKKQLTLAKCAHTMSAPRARPAGDVARTAREPRTSERFAFSCQINPTPLAARSSVKEYKKIRVRKAEKGLCLPGALSPLKHGIVAGLSGAMANAELAIDMPALPQDRPSSRLGLLPSARRVCGWTGLSATSALETVGLSSLGTSNLQPASQLVIVATMFIGRVGPLTVLVALTRRRADPKYSYPSERVMLG